MEPSGPCFAATLVHALAYVHAFEFIVDDGFKKAIIVPAFLFLALEIPVCIMAPTQLNTILHTAGTIVIFTLIFLESQSTSLLAPFVVFTALPFLLVLLEYSRFVWQAGNLNRRGKDS